MDCSKPNNGRINGSTNGLHERVGSACTYMYYTCGDVLSVVGCVFVVAVGSGGCLPVMESSRCRTWFAAWLGCWVIPNRFFFVDFSVSCRNKHSRISLSTPLSTPANDAMSADVCVDWHAIDPSCHVSQLRWMIRRPTRVSWAKADYVTACADEHAWDHMKRSIGWEPSPCTGPPRTAVEQEPIKENLIRRRLCSTDVCPY